MFGCFWDPDIRLVCLIHLQSFTTSLFLSQHIAQNITLFQPLTLYFYMNYIPLHRNHINGVLCKTMCESKVCTVWCLVLTWAYNVCEPEVRYKARAH